MNAGQFARICCLPMLVVAQPILVAAQSPTPTAESILRGMKAALEPSRPNLRDLRIVLRDAEGVETTWTARQASKPGPQGARVAIVLLTPNDITGTTLLTLEQPDGPNVQWVYVPTVRRVRKIYPVGGLQPALGTDFTYAELGFITMSDRSIKLLGTEKLGDVISYKIEEIPSDRWYYSRIVDWIATDGLLPMRREFYSKAGELWKVQLFESMTRVQDIPTPLVMRMEDRFEGGSTEIRIENVRYDVDVPEEVFEPKALPKLLDNPVWKSKR